MHLQGYGAGSLILAHVREHSPLAPSLRRDLPQGNSNIRNSESGEANRLEWTARRERET
jgi:hypothetical protein